MNKSLLLLQLALLLLLAPAPAPAQEPAPGSDYEYALGSVGHAPPAAHSKAKTKYYLVGFLITSFSK